MRTPLRAAARSALAALFVLATATCTEQPTEPGGVHLAQVRFTPVFRANAAIAGLPIDNVTVTVVRPAAETLAVRNAPFALTDSVLNLSLSVALNAPSESLQVSVALQNGAAILFQGTDTILVTSGNGGGPIPGIAMTYVGPGANIASMTLSPFDTVLSFGDTLQYAVTAIDSSDATVPSFYVHWSTTPLGAPILPDGRLVAPHARGRIMVHATTPNGTADSTPVTFMPVPTQVVKISGDLQGDTIGSTLPAPFVVEVRAADNLPVADVRVVFAATTPGGSVTVDSAVTDSLGRASSTGILGDTARSYSYTATVKGIAPATFTATANAGPAAAIAKVSGDAQSDTAGKTLPLPLVVRVADAGNNPVAGAMVIWTRTHGSGTPVLDTVLTDGAGHAQLTYTLGSPGTDSVRATLAGTGAFVDFTATASVAAVKVVVIAGDTQTDTVGRVLPESLVVQTQAVGSSTPVAGVQIVWTINVGTGILSADTTVTDSLGRSAVALAFSTVAGPVEVLVDAHQGGALGVFHFTAVSGPPHHLAFVVQPKDSIAVGVVMNPAPQVQVRDTFGNPVKVAGRVLSLATNTSAGAPKPPRFTPGKVLQFSGYPGGRDSALTDTNGIAVFDSATVVGSVGPETMLFSANALPIPALSWPFTMTPGLPNAVIATAGNGQTAFVDSVVPIPPQVTVVDTGGNGVPGVQVDFVVTAGGGSVTGGTVITDSLGKATVGSWRMGAVFGTDSLEARVTGRAPAVFTATAQPPVPTISLQLVGTSVVGVGRSAPLQVRLSSPAPVGGTVVSFSSDNPSVVSVDSASASFNPGDTTHIITLTGVAVGTAHILASAPGYVADTLLVTGTLNLISLPTTLNVPYGANTSIAVTLGQPAPAGGVVVTLISSDSTKVGIVTPTVNIPQGQTSANGTVHGTALGTAQVAAINPNYAPDVSTVSTTAALNIVNPAQTIFSTIPVTQTLEFRSAGALIAAPPGGIAANLTALDPTCVAVAATATIPAGLSTTTFTPSYGGSATLPCVTKVLATYPGVDPDTINITVNPPPTITIYGSDVGSGLATNSQIYLQVGVPTARNMVVRSLDTTKVLVANADTAVGADSAVIPLGINGSFSYYYIRGKEGIANDSALVQVDVPGFVSSQVWIRVRQPGVVLNAVPGTTTTFSAPAAISAYVGLPYTNLSGMQAYQPARPGGTLNTTFTFTLTPSGVAALMKADSVQDTVRTASLVPGQAYTGSIGQGGVVYVPLGPGVTTTTVAGAGYIALPGATATTTISAPTITIYGSDVGSGLATNSQIYLQVGVPTARNMIVRSLDTTKVLVANADTAVGGDSTVIPLGVNGSFSYYYIRGKEGIVNDSALVQVDVPGYVSSQVWIRVREAGVVLTGLPGTSTTFSAPSAISAYVGLPYTNLSGMQSYQPTRPGGTLNTTFTFTATPSGVAALMKADSVQDTVRTAALIPGQAYTGNIAQGGVVFVPLGPGSSTVTVSGPAGYIALPQASATSTISAPTMTVYGSDVGSGLATNSQIYLQVGVPTARSITVHSLDSTKVLVANADTAVGGGTAVIPLATNGSFAYYYIRGVDGILNDSALVQVDVPGYVSSQVWIRVRQPAIVLSGVPSTMTLATDSVPFTAYIGLPYGNLTSMQSYQPIRPGGTPITAHFKISTPGVGRLATSGGQVDSSTAPIAVGSTNSPSTVAAGGQAFKALTTGTDTVTVTTPGYVSLPQATQVVTVNAPGITVYSPGSVGAGLQAAGQIYLGASQHGGVTVWVKSSNPGVALVAANDTTPGADSVGIFLPNGQTFAYYWVQAVDSTSGTPIITVSANGFVDATTSVTVVQPGVVIAAVPSTMTSTAPDAGIYAYVGAPYAGNTGIQSYQERRAGAPPLVVTFTSDAPGSATLVNSGGPGNPRTANIVPGSYYSPTSVGTGGVAVRPVAVGSASISVAIPGFAAQPGSAATVNITP